MSDILATYTSHPIMRYKIGRFRFQNSTLKLTSEEDVKEFEAVLEALPVQEKIRIRKVDLAAAEKIVRERLAEQGGATKQVDSTVGERAGNAPRVGTGDLVKDAPKADEASAESAADAPKVPGLNLAAKA